MTAGPFSDLFDAWIAATAMPAEFFALAATVTVLVLKAFFGIACVLALPILSALWLLYVAKIVLGMFGWRGLVWLR